MNEEWYAEGEVNGESGGMNVRERVFDRVAMSYKNITMCNVVVIINLKIAFVRNVKKENDSFTSNLFNKAELRINFQEHLLCR